MVEDGGKKTLSNVLSMDNSNKAMSQVWVLLKISSC